MSKKVRVGFIGAGRHATRILYPSLRLTDLELVAVASLVAEEAERNAAWFGAKRSYPSHQALLEHERDLDAVLVAVAPPSYREVLASVLQAGLPVWSEKPAAGSASEAAELEQLSRQAGLPICVGYMKRFAPAYAMAKRASQDTQFGTPSFFNGKFAMGGGLYPDEYTFLVDNSVHMADLALYFMGDVENVQAQRTEFVDKRVAYAVLLKFASGAVGTLQLTTTQSWRSHNERVEVSGQGSAVVVDNVTRYQRFVPEGPGESWEPNYTVPSDANQTLMLSGYAYQLQHFAEVVRGEVSPKVTIGDGRKALELIDRIYQAAGGVLQASQRASAW